MSMQVLTGRPRKGRGIKAIRLNKTCSTLRTMVDRIRFSAFFKVHNSIPGIPCFIGYVVSSSSLLGSRRIMLEISSVVNVRMERITLATGSLRGNMRKALLMIVLVVHLLWVTLLYWWHVAYFMDEMGMSRSWLWN